METYVMHFECRNCDHSWSDDIPKGMPVRDSFRLCPNCGCSEGHAIKGGKGWPGKGYERPEFFLKDYGDNKHYCENPCEDFILGGCGICPASCHQPSSYYVAIK